MWSGVPDSSDGAKENGGPRPESLPPTLLEIYCRYEHGIYGIISCLHPLHEPYMVARSSTVRSSPTLANRVPSSVQLTLHT